MVAVVIYHDPAHSAPLLGFSKALRFHVVDRVYGSEIWAAPVPVILPVVILLSVRQSLYESTRMQSSSSFLACSSVMSGV